MPVRQNCICRAVAKTHLQISGPHHIVQYFYLIIYSTFCSHKILKYLEVHIYLKKGEEGGPVGGRSPGAAPRRKPGRTRRRRLRPAAARPRPGKQRRGSRPRGMHAAALAAALRTSPAAAHPTAGPCLTPVTPAQHLRKSRSSSFHHRDMLWCAPQFPAMLLACCKPALLQGIRQGVRWRAQAAKELNFPCPLWWWARGHNLASADVLHAVSLSFARMVSPYLVGGQECSRRCALQQHRGHVAAAHDLAVRPEQRHQLCRVFCAREGEMYRGRRAAERRERRPRVAACRFEQCVHRGACQNRRCPLNFVCFFEMHLFITV